MKEKLKNFLLRYKCIIRVFYVWFINYYYKSSAIGKPPAAAANRIAKQTVAKLKSKFVENAKQTVKNRKGIWINIFRNQMKNFFIKNPKIDQFCSVFAKKQKIDRKRRRSAGELPGPSTFIAHAVARWVTRSMGSAPEIEAPPGRSNANALLKFFFIAKRWKNIWNRRKIFFAQSRTFKFKLF